MPFGYGALLVRVDGADFVLPRRYHGGEAVDAVIPSWYFQRMHDTVADRKVLRWSCLVTFALFSGLASLVQSAEIAE